MIQTLHEYADSELYKHDKPTLALLKKITASSADIDMVCELNPYKMFELGYQQDANDWCGVWPSGSEVIAVPPQSDTHSGNAVGCRIVASEDAIPDGWSNAAYADALCCMWPDGHGGWALIEELLPVVPEEERNAAMSWLHSWFDVNVTPAQKHDALSEAIQKLPADTLREELIDYVKGKFDKV